MEHHHYYKSQSVVRISELLDILKISRSTVYNHIQRRILPKPFRLGLYGVGFLRSEIDALLIFIASSPSLDERLKFVRELPSQRLQNEIL